MRIKLKSCFAISLRLSKRITRVFSLCLLLWVGSSACYSFGASAPPQSGAEDLALASGITRAMLAAAASNGITNDVAAILAWLNALRYSSSSSGNIISVIPMASGTQSFLQALQRQMNETDSNTRNSSFLYEIQRALWGAQSVPGGHASSIAGLLETIAAHSNVWTRADIDRLLNLPFGTMTNQLNGLTDIANSVSSIGTWVEDVKDRLESWEDFANDDFDAWMVELNQNSLDDLQDIAEEQTATLLHAISNAVQTLSDNGSSDALQIVSAIESLIAQQDDSWGGWADNATYVNDLLDDANAALVNLYYGIVDLPASLSAYGTFDIDLSPVVDAIVQTDQHLERVRTQSLGYTGNQSQFLMLTNILATLVSIRDDLEEVDQPSYDAATNAIASAVASEQSAGNTISNLNQDIEDYCADDDTAPDWERHRYTNNPLDQFSDSLLDPLDQLDVLYTGMEDISGSTRITLFNGNFPVFAQSQSSSGVRSAPRHNVPLNISYGLTDTDVDVSSTINTCNQIFGWVWDFCACVLIGWLYKKFADWVATGTKIVPDLGS